MVTGHALFKHGIVDLLKAGCTVRCALIDLVVKKICLRCIEVASPQTGESSCRVENSFWGTRLFIKLEHTGKTVRMQVQAAEHLRC